jgi:hypothetical protein
MMQWLMLAVAIAGVVWLAFTLLRHRTERREESKAARVG